VKITLAMRYYIFFALIYAIQGINGLPGQAVYYLMREQWGWTIQTIQYIGAITMIPWVVKPIYGLFSDLMPWGGYRTRRYLIVNYILILAVCGYVLLAGLSYWTIIITGLLAGFALAFNDVACDSVMVRAEQKAGTLGKIQAVQWTSIGIVSLIVSLGGAYIAKYYGFKLAYGLMAILPAFGIWYIWRYHNEEKTKVTRSWSQVKTMFRGFKDKRLVLGALFLYALYLPPSFGTPLMAYMREAMHIDKMFIGLLGTLGGATEVLGFLVYLKWGFKWGMYKKLYACIVLGSISSLAYLYIPNQWWLLAYGLIFGGLMGIIHLTILSYAAKIVPKGSEGFIFAGLMSVLNLGSQTSITLGGLLYGSLGFRGLVILSGIVSILPLAVVHLLRNQDRKMEEVK
jgi:MFS family permease